MLIFIRDLSSPNIANSVASAHLNEENPFEKQGMKFNKHLIKYLPFKDLKEVRLVNKAMYHAVTNCSSSFQIWHISLDTKVLPAFFYKEITDICLEFPEDADIEQTWICVTHFLATMKNRIKGLNIKLQDLISLEEYFDFSCMKVIRIQHRNSDVPIGFERTKILKMIISKASSNLQVLGLRNVKFSESEEVDADDMIELQHKKYLKLKEIAFDDCGNSNFLLSVINGSSSVLKRLTAHGSDLSYLQKVKNTMGSLQRLDLKVKGENLQLKSESHSGIMNILPKCQNLEDLELNQINLDSAIPDAMQFPHLRNLQLFNCSGSANQLQFVLQHVSAKVSKLDIWNCKMLIDKDFEFFKFPKLEHLSLSGNGTATLSNIISIAPKLQVSLSRSIILVSKLFEWIFQGNKN